MSPTLARGFAPIEPPAGQARLLILGSLPGCESLAQQQYYAHPRNAFWPIMQALTGIDAAAPYARRCADLEAVGIALWDVLAAGERPGSLDASIVASSARPNELAALLARQTNIVKIAFNGKAASALFARHVLRSLSTAQAALPQETLPSTSPAHAGISFAAKLEIWRSSLAPALPPRHP